jgi:hypothetical protein
MISRNVVNPNNPSSVSAKARHRRWGQFLTEFPDINAMRVLDLGGTPAYWQAAPCTPRAVTVVNLDAHDSNELVTAIQGDACAPPAEVTRERFDLVVSNSLIEHVGGHVQRQRLADVVHAASDLHWVQTPYRYFPVEPHWMFPGFQFLPFAARVRVTRSWPLGHRHTDDSATAVASVHEVDLVGIDQMRSYFPDSRIWFERMGGLVKSLVAVRSA